MIAAMQRSDPVWILEYRLSDWDRDRWEFFAPIETEEAAKLYVTNFEQYGLKMSKWFEVGRYQHTRVRRDDGITETFRLKCNYIIKKGDQC